MMPWEDYKTAAPQQESGPWSDYKAPQAPVTDASDSEREQQFGVGGSLPGLDKDNAAMSLVHSKVLGIPPSAIYNKRDVLDEQLKKRGMEVSKSMGNIASDIKSGAEGSIFGLSYRQKMPESLRSQGMFDEFVSGLSTMVADLPFYIGGAVLGGAAGGAAGSAIPVVGNVAGAIGGGAMGTFAVPDAIRKSLVLGIQKGDIKSFGDLMDRTLDTFYAGEKGALTGLVTEGAGETTFPQITSKLGQMAMKKAQQAAALTILPKVLEGQMPELQDFAINSALLVAMHVTMGGIEKAGELSPKVQARVQDEYVKSGTHPSKIASDALVQAQESPTDHVIDRINELTRTPEPVEEEAKATEPKEKVAVPQPPPPLLRPAIRAEDGTVSIGERGEVHPDIVDRSGSDGERGFVDNKDQFHTRDEARARLHEAEPETYEHWVREAGSPEEEFHTTDYNAAMQASTGVKNAAVDAQREQRGLPPLESSTPTKRADVYDQAKAAVDNGDIDPLKLAESVNKRNRGISDVETDALNYYNAQLSNQHKGAMDAIEKARADDDPIAEAKGKERLQQVEDNQDIVEKAARIAGTQSGRALRARQEMIAQDYSLDRVLQRARVASKDGQVSPDVRDRLETLTTQLDTANKKISDFEANQSKRNAQRTVDTLKERTQRKAITKQDRIGLDEEFDKMVKQFDSLVGRMSANPFTDPELIGLMGKMAINRIGAGLSKIEEIVSDIHAKLTDIGHDISERDIRDAISGYGRTKELSKDQINVALREAKRQGQLLSALEDAQAKELPLRSGLQRDKASDRVRDLQKQVKQAMRDSGIDAKSGMSPEQQWKSSLDAVKTRLRNQLKDLKAGKEAVKRTAIELDAEAKGLKSQVEYERIKKQQASGELDLKLRKMLQMVEGKPGVHPERKLKMAMDATQRSVDELDRRIRENDLTPAQRRSGTPETPALTALRAERDALRETYRQMQEAAKPKKSAEQAALDRYKKVLSKRIEEMEGQLKTGDFSKEPHKATVLDPEATELKTNAEKLRRKIDDQVAEQKRQARSKTEKVVDTVTKWRRFGLLSGVSTLGKLTKAAMDRMGVTPVEELLGGVLSQIPGISKISERAPMHGGGLNLSAEVKAVSQLWQKATAKDMWDEAVHGHDQLDLLFGGKAKLPAEVLGFFGQLHGALKVPEKRAEFFRRFEIGMEYAKKNNLDVNDPKIQSVVGQQAYLESQRAILMQDNALTSGYNVMLAYLHNQGALGRTFASGARFIFPMVRVATNLPGEALTYTPPALVVRGAQVFKLLADKDRMGKSAFDNLTMHDMDNVMRGLKKGSVGLALSAIGFAFRNSITGYYLTPQEQKQGIKRGIMKIGGVTIPAYLNDTPPLIAIQLAATVGHVWDHYRLKGMSGGLIAGAAQAGVELGKRVPFYGTVARSADATRTPEQTMVDAGDFAGSLMVPRLANEIAQFRDPEQHRKAKTFTDAIKLQVPGLRETVGTAGTRHTIRKRGYN